MQKKYDINDPIAYEIFKHRLWSICERSHYTLSRVSGSPIVTDAHEYLSGLHKADGEAVMVTSGVVLHLVGMEFAIKKIIEWSETDEDPIEEGDQYLFNDPYIACLHTTDMGIMKPVFYQDKIVAWVSSLFHTPSVPSAMDPAGACPSAVNIFQEGLRGLGLRIVDRGRLRHDIMRTLKYNAHDPDLLGLDHVSKIAANNVASNEVIKMIEQFGLEFVSSSFDRIINETKELCRQKVIGLPDGKWQSVLYLDTTGRETKSRKVSATLIKKDDRIIFDYTGTAPQEPGSVQLTGAGALGHLFVVLASQLFWDVPWNSGILKAIEYIFPKGSLVNVDYPSAVSNAPTVVAVENAAHQCVAKMLASADELRKDINAGWAGAGSPKFAGINQYGRPFTAALMTAFACGEGARVDMDGVDTGGLMMSPESEIANVETHEMFYPLLYLWRKEACDSGGPGKFRGGLGLDHAFILHKAPKKTVTGIGIATGDVFTFIPGVFGGYPGCLRGCELTEGSDILEIISKGILPSNMEEIAGKSRIIRSTDGTFNFNEGEVARFIIAGGGGYGDPIERDPQLILRDIKNGATHTELARKVYGVVLDNDNGGNLDLEKTRKERDAIRNARLKRGKPVNKIREFIKIEKDIVRKEGRRITEELFILKRDGKNFIYCGNCGLQICKADENYKLYILIADRDPRSIGLPAWLHPDKKSGMVYREFYCPSCAMMLDVEPTMGNSNIIHDIIIETRE